MNIAVTWPKARSLQSYFDELAKAVEHGLEINYRVAPNPPGKLTPGDRCYMVYDGFVRGWNVVLRVEMRSDVIDPTTGVRMRPGWYIVRDPEWHPWEGTSYPMEGFRGFRYVAAGLSAKGAA